MKLSNRDNENENRTPEDDTQLKLSDKLWIALAIILFLVAFAIILVFGVF